MSYRWWELVSLRNLENTVIELDPTLAKRLDNLSNQVTQAQISVLNAFDQVFPHSKFHPYNTVEYGEIWRTSSDFVDRIRGLLLQKGQTRTARLREQEPELEEEANQLIQQLNQAKKQILENPKALHFVEQEASEEESEEVPIHQYEEEEDMY